MPDSPPSRFVGRATNLAPPNRFEQTRQEADHEHLTGDDELLAAERSVPTVFLPDRAATLIRENDSPDIPFRYSLNPYRGCEHGCAYCYARPTHETLGLNAGLDFETKILVKHDAPQLLRRELNHRRWRCEPIMMSGVTDCYQPAERRYRLTRGILEVLLEARQPACIITKNALICRDIDVLAEMAKRNLVSTALSITTLDADLARTLEPRTATPAAKLRAVRDLADAGVPVRVMVAPIIPGLTDNEIPAILAAAEGGRRERRGLRHAPPAAGRRAGLHRLAPEESTAGGRQGRVAHPRDARRAALSLGLGRANDAAAGLMPKASPRPSTFSVASSVSMLLGNRSIRRSSAPPSLDPNQGRLFE